MKHSTQAFLIWLPALVALTLTGWLVFGALPNMHMTGDLIAWLMELPVTTCYAIAAAGATLTAMNITGINIDNGTRAQLFERALAGDVHAKWALTQETKAWIGFLVIFGVFFFPHY